MTADPAPIGKVGPLKGITVLALEQAVAAPFATRQLADLGARVIKIERPGVGDFARAYDSAVHGMASHFVWLNRSKESLSLNLKREKAVSILHRLLSRADVFVHNLAPGAVERLGFEAAGLRVKYPQLIICSISGYGSSGLYRDQKAYDLLVQCEAGLLSITGTEDVPCKVGISVADIAGGMYAFSGILAALLDRSKSGEGSVVEISLLDALGEWMSYPALYTRYGGQAPPRTGPAHATIAPYGPFASSDNVLVYIAIQNEREWASFCEHVLGRPGISVDARFDSNTRRVANRSALENLINSVFGKLPAEQIRERLQSAQIAHARMNSVEEFLAHPQLSARHRWRDVGTPAGPARVLLPPINMERVEPVMAPVPALGEHTNIILNELGFDADYITALREDNVI